MLSVQKIPLTNSRPRFFRSEKAVINNLHEIRAFPDHVREAQHRYLTTALEPEGFKAMMTRRLFQYDADQGKVSAPVTDFATNRAISGEYATMEFFLPPFQHHPLFSQTSQLLPVELSSQAPVLPVFHSYRGMNKVQGYATGECALLGCMVSLTHVAKECGWGELPPYLMARALASLSPAHSVMRDVSERPYITSFGQMKNIELPGRRSPQTNHIYYLKFDPSLTLQACNEWIKACS